MDEAFGSRRQKLVVSVKASLKSPPCKGSLNNPTPRDNLKASSLLLVYIWQVALDLTPPRIDHLKSDPQMALRPAFELARVALIGPDALQSGKSSMQRVKQKSSTFAVIDVGRQYFDGE